MLAVRPCRGRAVVAVACHGGIARAVTLVDAQKVSWDRRAIPGDSCFDLGLRDSEESPFARYALKLPDAAIVELDARPRH